MGSSSPPQPHALVLPYPLQGHIIPLMELSHCLVDHGFSVTFVNTHFNHARILDSLPGPLAETAPLQRVSVPDGLEPGVDRNDIGRLTLAISECMPGHLEEMIRASSTKSKRGPVTCIIADHNMAWAFDVARKMGLRAAAFWPGSAAMLMTILSAPNMMDDGTIDANGVPTEHRMIRLGPEMLLMNTAHFWWNHLGGTITGRIVFDYMMRGNKSIETVEWVLCNSFAHAEHPLFNHAPRLCPIGPLLPGVKPDRPVGRYWPEDSSCEEWLDRQPLKSVVYVAFGSLTVFDQRQFEELALGLEIMGRRFLWVVRPDLTEADHTTFLRGFEERMAGRGRMVGWSPQQMVLAHPSIACFVSHCGWNSTMEGVTNGVPFLCWPYFADQFLNESYICDLWKVGLRLCQDTGGIVTKEEIKTKVDALLGDREVVGRALEWKEMAELSIAEGGSSYNNLNEFIESMKTFF